MAFAISSALSTVANNLAKVLIEQSAVLGGGAVGHVEWIEKELRSMQGLLEQVEQHGYCEQEQELTDLVEKLKEIAREAGDVIETFVIKSGKRRRTGFLYWKDKYRVAKELVQIRNSMSEISDTILKLNTNASVSSLKTTQSVKRSRIGFLYWKNKYQIAKKLVQTRKSVSEISDTIASISSVETTHGGEASSSSTTTTSVVVAPAIEKLDHILSHIIVTGGDEVMEMVERVKSELMELQNIVNNLKSTSERENIWLEQVKNVCNYTESAAGKFILVEERPSKMDRLEKVLYVLLDYDSAWKFKKQMYYVRKQIGDALGRSLTYEIGGQLDMRAGDKRSTPLQDLSLESFLAGDTRPFQSVLLALELWMSVDKNLKWVQKDLDLMFAFLRDTESESAEGLMNERQKVWVSQLRLMAQNGQSLVDAYSNAAGCFLRFSRRLQFSMDVNRFLKEILNISHHKTVYRIGNIIQGTQEELVVATNSQSIEEEREIQREIQPPPAPSPADSPYRPLTGLKEKVQSIRAGMELMDALFRDIQNTGRGELDRISGIWVDQMEGIATEARSAINDYSTKLEHKSILRLLFNYRYQPGNINKIDEIRNKIEDTWRRRKTYGFLQIQSRDMSSSSTVQILHGRTQPSVVFAVAKETSIVGFDDDSQVLMTQLLSHEKRRSITWIVGIRGTGKTTLAKSIFQDNTVVSHFDCRIWVSLPSTSNCTAQQLLDEIAREAAKVIKGDPLSDPVLETLVGKMYLIVIDGIEETSQVYLDTLKLALPDMSTRSRILFTTRNAKIAHHAAGSLTFVHPLQLLDDEISWVLFTRHLKVHIPQEELMKVGREFVMKCGGLPSQILKISDLFSQKDVTLTHEEWSSMFNQIQDQVQSWSETLKIINTDLPLYLRRCLSYFGLFPSDFGIPVRRLVVLWIAESLVHHSDENQEPPELVAERYLTELIDRNMVQVAARKRNGKIKTCRLPNALRQLWLKESKDSRFLQGPQSATDSNADPKNSIIRRVADHLNSDDIWHDHIHGDTTSPNSSSLRTYYKDVLSFMSFDPQEGSKPGEQIGNFLRGCILGDCFLQLRVLDLERVYKPKLPKRIKKLTRLRYLGLRWTYLESLPSSISNLLKLQTLDLKHTYIHTLPISIWKMELRHLFLSETYRTRFPPQPKGNSLSDIQTLWGLFVDEETPVKGGLDNLVDIKKLGLACQSMSLQEEAMRKQLDAVAYWITKLEKLQSLRLKSRDEKGKPWILLLESFVNHTNLTDLYLLGSLSSSNVLSQFPLSLIELTLSHSKLVDDPMKLLKDFPNLRTLCLLAESYVGASMVCESHSFPQLRVLKFWVLEQLEEWKIEQGALPCLRQLEIRLCPNLKMLPDGLKHVNTLLELKLTSMPMEIGADLHNILPNCQVVRQNFQ